jgi:hypothetical protein
MKDANSAEQGCGWRGRIRSAAVVATVLAGVALLASACGGGSGSPGVASLGSTTTSTAAAASPGGSPVAGLPGKLEAFSACMRSHGVVNFPSPIINGNHVSVQIGPNVDPNSAQFRSASKACQGLLPKGSAEGPVITPKQQADYLSAANCMRSHGFANFPDPVFSKGNVSFPLPSDMDPNSLPFRRAREICENLIPPGLPFSKQAEGGQ